MQQKATWWRDGYFNCNSCSCVLRLACGCIATDKNISSCEVIPGHPCITCHYHCHASSATPCHCCPVTSTVMSLSVPSSTIPCQHCHVILHCTVTYLACHSLPQNLVTTAKVDIRQFSEANADANKYKNRFMNFLPCTFVH